MSNIIPKKYINLEIANHSVTQSVTHSLTQPRDQQFPILKHITNGTHSIHVNQWHIAEQITTSHHSLELHIINYQMPWW